MVTPKSISAAPEAAGVSPAPGSNSPGAAISPKSNVPSPKSIALTPGEIEVILLGLAYVHLLHRELAADAHALNIKVDGVAKAMDYRRFLVKSIRSALVL